ncbi:nucleotide modification associated domain-containing protein [Clostridium botulinum]|uniref:nucleotide modification associated domain-containing protein n=1 Tax=Clostridium botulinum TaxID=1491 RepID=UPI0006803ED2|nr:nucleotide modification associated domain-containing protein [Clostridium botulinum]
MCKRVYTREETKPTIGQTLKKYERHQEICDELNKIYKAKNHDYGDSFGETYKKLGIISAVTRITDKVNRLQSLCTKDALVDESIKDTLMDCANYCIMTLIELEGEDN